MKVLGICFALIGPLVTPSTISNWPLLLKCLRRLECFHFFSATEND
jgi:hypothetical protein